MPLRHPAEADVRQVLHPLEVGDGHAARVGVDVRDDQDPLVAKDRIGGGVVGPLAPSRMIFALTRGALSAVNTPSSAAGIRTSHSISSAAALVGKIGRAGEVEDRFGLLAMLDDLVLVQTRRGW